MDIATSPEAPWNVILCDSLEKVFPGIAPRPFTRELPLIGFRGETMSFQVAIRWTAGAEAAGRERVRVELGADSELRTRISAVELVPVEYPAPPAADDGYLSSAPGLYPDLLVPAEDGGITAMIGQWRALWIDLVVSPDASSRTGSLPLRVFVGDTPIAEFDVLFELIGVSLPELDIPHTHWFHCDGLANFYGLEVWSEEHWAVIDKQFATLREISANTILTPVWTPPLDTAIGHRRTPTQLIGITEAGPDSYAFDFTKLIRWIELCRAHGFRSLEMPHLFTQWSAKATAAIDVRTDEGLEPRFGWHVASTDPRYRAFLEQLLPQLLALLDREWGLERVIFHISDEPTPENIVDYAVARESVLDLLDGCTIVDAISDFDLYATGIVPEPVVATDHATAFLQAGVQPWLYYCMAQDADVANRFIALPSTRSRVIGAQLHKVGARGFLHWGFNFYNAAKSIAAIDPFRDTCAGRSFPGGDAFLVYPGSDGAPLQSIRFRVFAEAMNDLRAMQAVRGVHGSARVDAIVDPDGSLALDAFSYDPDHYRQAFVELARAVKEEQA